MLVLEPGTHLIESKHLLEFDITFQIWTPISKDEAHISLKEVMFIGIG